MSEAYERNQESRGAEKSASEQAAASASAACSRQANQSSICSGRSFKPEATGYVTFPPLPELSETRRAGAQEKNINLTAEREHLDRQISSLADSKILNSSLATQARADMFTFEKRAREQGLSSETVAKTYSQVTRLLQANGEQPVSAAERVSAALDIMAIAAEPTSNNQGAHNTCNVTALENRLFTRQPDIASGMIADLASTGKYVAKDGTTVALDKESLTIQPEELEAANQPRGANYRNYASQLFQVAAINLLYEKENQQTGGDKHYVQGCDDDHSGARLCPGVKIGSELLPNPTGEKVVSYSKAGEPGTVSIDMMEQRGGSLQDLVDINTMITGKYEPEAFLQRKETVKPGEERGNLIGTREEFEAQLARLKSDRQLPAVVAVNVANEPFYSLMQRSGQPEQADNRNGAQPRLDTSTLGHDGHWILITDYNPKTHQLKYDNQAGNDQDPAAPVSVEKFYEAMTGARATVWLERLESARSARQVSDNEYAAGLGEIMSEYTKRWSFQKEMDSGFGKFDAQDEQAATRTYEKALTRLSPRAVAMVREKVRHALDFRESPQDQEK